MPKRSRSTHLMVAAASICIPDCQFRTVYCSHLCNQLRDLGCADTRHRRVSCAAQRKTGGRIKETHRRGKPSWGGSSGAWYASISACIINVMFASRVRNSPAWVRTTSVTSERADCQHEDTYPHRRSSRSIPALRLQRRRVRRWSETGGRAP